MQVCKCMLSDMQTEAAERNNADRRRAATERTSVRFQHDSQPRVPQIHKHIHRKHTENIINYYATVVVVVDGRRHCPKRRLDSKSVAITSGILEKRAHHLTPNNALRARALW